MHSKCECACVCERECCTGCIRSEGRRNTLVESTQSRQSNKSGSSKLDNTQNECVQYPQFELTGEKKTLKTISTFLYFCLFLFWRVQIDPKRNGLIGAVR